MATRTPQEAAQLRKDAYAAYAAADYSTAISILDGEVAIQPSDADLRFLRAKSLYARYAVAYKAGKAKDVRDDIPQAIRDLDEVLARRPTFAEAYDYRGMLQATVGKYERALADYATALKLKPDLIGTLYGRAHVYELLGRYTEAISDYREFVRRSRNQLWREKATERILLLSRQDSAKAS